MLERLFANARRHRHGKATRARRFSPDLLEKRDVPATLPTGFVVETVVPTGIHAPTAMVIAPDGRVLVTEQTGRVRVIREGELLAEPMLELEVASDGERGLVGIALDPQFDRNGLLYVYYTVPGELPHNRVSRFRVTGDVADRSSEQVLLEIDPPATAEAKSHAGGSLLFGRDGRLYIGVGDHGRREASPQLSTLHGKVLRINKNGTIPRGNPFFRRVAGNLRAIYAIGLRNPYTMAAQPETGRIFVNDVGQKSWEEINRLVAGAHYGWPHSEGRTSIRGHTNPVHAYPYFGTAEPVDQQGCAIVGGLFTPRKGTFPAAYRGKYFFADLCLGELRMLDPATRTVSKFAVGLPRVAVDIDFAPDGSMYHLSRTNWPDGQVVRIRYVPNGG